jgi:oligosaccharide repeat unit polymerase
VNFFPRQFWPDKPIAFGIILSGQYFDVQLDETFTNFGPGIVAESYANGGYLAIVVVSCVLGVVVGLIDRTIENNRYNWNAVLFGMVFYPALFFVVRGDFLNSFYEIYFKAGVIWVVTAGLGLRRRLRPPNV